VVGGRARKSVLGTHRDPSTSLGVTGYSHRKGRGNNLSIFVNNSFRCEPSNRKIWITPAVLLRDHSPLTLLAYAID
jgi:hypothetical protein